MRLRLAMATPRYPPYLGGTETHVFEVGRHLAAAGVEVTVLTTDPGGALPRTETNGSLCVRRFSTRPRRGDLYWAPQLLRALGTGDYDLVHVQGVHNLLAPTVLSAARRAGIPTVVTFHTGGHSSRVRTALRDRQWRALRRRLLGARALVAVSEHEIRTFARALRIDPASIHLIRNGTDLLPVSDRPVPVSGRPLVASLGRLERYKGHQRLIEAMPHLLARAPQAHLVLVGRGTYERQLRRLANRLGLAGSVTITAFEHRARGELGALVAASDVVALMSEYEAHPVAILEALALGRPVVVADAPGLSELTGYDLVTAVRRDAGPAELARVLVDVAGQPARPAPALPTWSDTTNALRELYAQVLRPASTALSR